jgi:hypothetical protein
MKTEKLLFVCHGGSVGNQPAGILIDGHCLPIAFSHDSWVEGDRGEMKAEDGLMALWESTIDVEDFFETLGIGNPEGGGLWIYEVSYDEATIDADDEDMPWLEGGSLRRPTVEELEPLARGEAPWGGVVL